MAKRAEFMRYLAQIQAEESAQNLKQISELAALSSAKSKLAEMLNSGRLQEIFGDEIAGTPTEKVLDLTSAEIWGG